MFEPRKIFNDDPLVHYRNSTVNPEATKHQVDALLSEYGLVNIKWTQNGEVYTVHFEAPFKGRLIPIRKTCPLIYDRNGHVDWTVSMRTLYWGLKAALENAYVSSITIVETFLSNVVINGTTLKDTIMPQLEQR